MTLAHPHGNLGLKYSREITKDLRDHRLYVRVKAKNGLPRGLNGKKKKKKIHLTSRRCGFHLWVRKIPWRRKWQSTPVFLPGESHRQKTLEGSSSWGCNWTVTIGHNLVTKQQSHEWN